MCLAHGLMRSLGFTGSDSRALQTQRVGKERSHTLGKRQVLWRYLGEAWVRRRRGRPSRDPRRAGIALGLKGK